MHHDHMMLKSFSRSDGWWVQILLMAYFTSMDPPLSFGFVCFAHGLGMGKGMMGSNHHPFCFFALSFIFLFFFFLFFLDSWIRKEAMEIFNNLFTTKNKIWLKNHLGT
jgi:hypothetical protein